MKFTHESVNYYHVACENCSKENRVLKTNCIPIDIGYKSTVVVMCSCGKSDNIIKKPANKELFKNHEPQEPLHCPKCKSTQLYAGDKGFSLGKAAAGGLLTGSPVGLLGGLIGSKKLIIGCMNCGHKWEAGNNK